MKLKSVKFANSIALGGKESYFFSDDLGQDIILDGNLIKIKDRARGHKVVSSVFNMILCHEMDEPAQKSSLVKAEKK